VPLVPARKFGKLPGATVREVYSLEYGEDTIEIHRDALGPGRRVAVVDDLLATGGTAAAVAELATRRGGEIVELAFVIELDFLKGRERLKPRPVFSLIHF
jgi:adenine phosphoribosyltransferase